VPGFFVVRVPVAFKPVHCLWLRHERETYILPAFAAD
jgi:hypothetical protein